jgi:hypothetical protein
MQRCSETGDDWGKIKHIENVQIELRPWEECWNYAL